MIKKFTISFLLMISIIPFSFTTNVQPVQAQIERTSTISIMTVTSMGNDNVMQNQTIENQSINYYSNATGYLVYPSPNQNNEKLPAVVMIHENRGLNDYIKESANILAKQGYVVLAVDLFEGEIAQDQNRARELTSVIRDNPDIAIDNMKSAVSYLGSLDNVDASRIASMGWCFGGQQSLQLAINSKDHPLAATIIYYGRLTNDTQALSNIQWPVLGIFGEEDQSIPSNDVRQFEQNLNQLGIPNEIQIYPGVGHAFANPSNDNYAPKETADAWRKTLEFLKDNV